MNLSQLISDRRVAPNPPSSRHARVPKAIKHSPHGQGHSSPGPTSAPSPLLCSSILLQRRRTPRQQPCSSILLCARSLPPRFCSSASSHSSASPYTAWPDGLTRSSTRWMRRQTRWTPNFTPSRKKAACTSRPVRTWALAWRSTCLPASYVPPQLISHQQHPRSHRTHSTCLYGEVPPYLVLYPRWEAPSPGARCTLCRHSQAESRPRARGEYTFTGVAAATDGLLSDSGRVPKALVLNPQIPVPPRIQPLDGSFPLLPHTLPAATLSAWVQTHARGVASTMLVPTVLTLAMPSPHIYLVSPRPHMCSPYFSVFSRPRYM